MPLVVNLVVEGVSIKIVALGIAKMKNGAYSSNLISKRIIVSLSLYKNNHGLVTETQPGLNNSNNNTKSAKERYCRHTKRSAVGRKKRKNSSGISSSNSS